MSDRAKEWDQYFSIHRELPAAAIRDLFDEIEHLHKEHDYILDDMDDLRESLRLHDKAAELSKAENERLRAALAKSCEEGRDGMYDCGYNRLRTALEEIESYGGAQGLIAREALNATR